MKNIIIILTTILMSMCMYAQKDVKISKVSTTEFNSFQKKPNFQSLLKNANSLGYNILNKSVESESFNLVTKDESGKVSISLLVYSLKNNNNETLEIVELKNNISKESFFWSETDKINYTIDKTNKVVTTPKTVNEKSSFNSCLNQYLKPGATNCTNCVNCVSSCIQNNKKWKRFSCMVFNCSRPCIGCVVNLWNFFKCILK